jgi:hypothetical protein
MRGLLGRQPKENTMENGTEGNGTSNTKNGVLKFKTRSERLKEQVFAKQREALALGMSDTDEIAAWIEKELRDELSKHQALIADEIANWPASEDADEERRRIKAQANVAHTRLLKKLIFEEVG